MKCASSVCCGSPGSLWPLSLCKRCSLCLEHHTPLPWAWPAQVCRHQLSDKSPLAWTMCPAAVSPSTLYIHRCLVHSTWQLIFLSPINRMYILRRTEKYLGHIGISKDLHVIGIQHLGKEWTMKIVTMGAPYYSFCPSCLSICLLL